MNCKGCMTICTTSKKPNDPTKCAGFIHRTNENLLRTKRDEELAKWFCDMAVCQLCPIADCTGTRDCETRWLNWLRQEAEE